MPPEDLAKLRWMLEAAEMALSFSQGRSRSDLETQPMYYYAVVKAVELVGEAASKVTIASQSELQGILWEKIIPMRNILVHNFHGINRDILWEAIRDDMPTLITQLQETLARHEG